MNPIVLKIRYVESRDHETIRKIVTLRRGKIKFTRVTFYARTGKVPKRPAKTLIISIRYVESRDHETIAKIVTYRFGKQTITRTTNYARVRGSI